MINPNDIGDATLAHAIGKAAKNEALVPDYGNNERKTYNMWGNKCSLPGNRDWRCRCVQIVHPTGTKIVQNELCLRERGLRTGDA